MWWLEFSDLVLRYERRLSREDREVYRTGECVGNPRSNTLCEYYLVSVSRKAGLQENRRHLPEDAENGEAADATAGVILWEVQGMQEQIDALTTQVKAIAQLLSPTLHPDPAGSKPNPDLRRAQTHTSVTKAPEKSLDQARTVKGRHAEAAGGKAAHGTKESNVTDRERGHEPLASDVSESSKNPASTSNAHTTAANAERVHVELDALPSPGCIEGEAVGGTFVGAASPLAGVGELVSPLPVTRRRARKESASAPCADSEAKPAPRPEGGAPQEGSEGSPLADAKRGRRRDRAALRAAAAELVEEVSRQTED